MIKIVGGGLAGLSLGVYLQKMGIQTVLYEAGQYPKHKVCGEFICGVEERILYEMGVGNIIEDAEHHHEMSWWMGEDKVLQRETPAVAWGLSRYKLDEDLAEKFQRLGGTLHLGERIKGLSGEGVINGIGKSKREQGWIGLKVHAVDVQKEWIQGLEMHAGQRGYLGLCGVEKQRVNCCGLFKVDKSIKGKGSELLLNYLRVNGLESLAERLGGADLDEASFSATAGFTLGKQSAGDGFNLGDTAYLIPPFTGNGMSMALESAYLAGKRIKAFTEGAADWDASSRLYQQDCERFFRKRMGLAMKLHPLLFSEIGQLSLKVSARAGILPLNFLFNQLRTP